MSEFKPTASQQAAIDLRGSTALVSAGAGSGKTKVLTERLMHYVLDPDAPADIDSFLIITFTRPAAGELRGRIMDALAEALAKDPGNKRLRRQSALCSKAQISTIHSFCSTLIRENSQALGISQDFKILDDDRAGEMKFAALSRVLEERYAAQDDYPGFKALADTVGVGRDDSRLVKLALSLYEKMQCHARPEKWCREQKALMTAVGIDVASTAWGQELMEQANMLCNYYAEEFGSALQIMSGEPAIEKAYGDAFNDVHEQLKNFSVCLAIGWDRARECLPLKFPKLKPLRKKDTDEELAASIKARWDDCKDAAKKLSDIFYSDSEQLMKEMRMSAPAMCALLDLASDFDREYARAKRRAGFLDYSDLEHMSAALLTEEDGSPTELAKTVSRRYTEIMVDEYQDVSKVQDTIFRAVSRNGKNLFMVGDVKQSIYRFRLADPEIFTNKYECFADNDAAAPGEDRRILLRENFRSRQEIIDCANAVFSNCMSKHLGDLDYDENAALKFGASYFDGSVPVPEILLLRQPTAEDDEDESPDKVESEARMVALRIKSLIESGACVGSGGSERPMTYGDIAILMRSPNNIAHVYKRILAQHGVPVASGQGGGFYSSIEISAVTSMLAVIDNPHQDIPLIAVLRSPAFGFSADELSRIRALRPDADFYTALCEDSGENSLKFLEKLRILRDTAADMSAPELLWYLYNELDMLALCSAMSDGEQRRRNLLALLQLSEKFSATGYRGLHRFVLWLKRLAENNKEPSAGSADSNAVQIMSVHKSKGLEFPVVFLCDTSRKFNFADASEAVLVHPELGLGPKVTDLARRVEYPTLARNAINLRLKAETRSEEMRLMYVALTRPKERLFITACVKDPDKLMDKLLPNVTSPMAPQILDGCSNPINWLLYAALADKEKHLRIKFCEDEASAAEEESTDALPDGDIEVSEKLAEALSFRYAHAEAEKLPSKVTATELKHYAEPDPDAQNIAPVYEHRFRMPDFTKKDKPITGTERGIATHLVLQYMDFKASESVEGIKREIDRLYEKKFLTARERDGVDAEAVYKLFASPVGQRMKKADRIVREFKFSLLCDAGEVFGASHGDEVLMQGVVDCCIIENGELTIIDYKTDSVFGDEVEKRAASYKPQISAYASALERIFGMKAKECVLYFLRASKAVEIQLR